MKSKKYRLSAIVFYSVIITLALGLPNVAFATCVPDTGQTQSYTDTFGEDSDYTINPPSYTDLGSGVVRDNVTGLEWQQATAPGTFTWQQALDYCAGLSLGGHDDWRLPTIQELSTLIDSSIPQPGPTINTIYFPDTIAFRYWSSTTCAFVSEVWVWQVHFDNGYVDYSTGTSVLLYVRAVRGGQSQNNFIYNGDGTVTDTATGLMWQQTTAPGTFTWEQALTYCENLTLAGKSDWRLPNRNELQTIVNYSSSPASYFGCVPSPYWSSTADAGGSYFAWYVNFNDGRVCGYGHGDMSVSYYIRAVRGGQCGPTVIDLSSFTATPKAGKVILKWTTESEIDNAGFNHYRAESEDGEYVKINSSLIPAEGTATSGATYQYVDDNVRNKKTYCYKLEDIDLNGTSTMHGPVRAEPRLISRRNR